MDVKAQDEPVHEAARFAATAPMLRALGDVAGDEERWAQANRDIDGFLGDLGVTVPERLKVRPIPWPEFSTPDPAWQRFTIRLTMCTKVWVRDEPGGMIREAELCRGFEIVESLPPGGPIG